LAVQHWVEIERPDALIWSPIEALCPAGGSIREVAGQADPTESSVFSYAMNNY
jgi:hypothetical protein